MTSPEARAIEVIDYVGDEPSNVVAAALAKEGLLAPDLPQANDTSLPLPTRSWVLDAEGSPVVWSAPGTTVMIQRIEPGDLFPAQARRFALNILAAADYCEGEPDATD